MRRENRASGCRRSVKQAGGAPRELQRVLRRQSWKMALERPSPLACGNQSMPSGGMSRKFPAKHVASSRRCE
jgi:hypothetical protein